MIFIVAETQDEYHRFCASMRDKNEKCWWVYRNEQVRPFKTGVVLFTPSATRLKDFVKIFDMVLNKGLQVIDWAK